MCDIRHLNLLPAAHIPGMDETQQLCVLDVEI